MTSVWGYDCLLVGWLLVWLVGWFGSRTKFEWWNFKRKGSYVQEKTDVNRFHQKGKRLGKQLKTKPSSAVPSLKPYSSPTETRHSENSWSIPINLQVLKCQGIWDLLATPTQSFPPGQTEIRRMKKAPVETFVKLTINNVKWASTISNEHQQHQVSMVDPLEGNIYLADSWWQLVYLYMHVYIYI